VSTGDERGGEWHEILPVSFCLKRKKSKNELGKETSDQIRPTRRPWPFTVSYTIFKDFNITYLASLVCGTPQGVLVSRFRVKFSSNLNKLNNNPLFELIEQAV
jgi:hypothetical protein